MAMAAEKRYAVVSCHVERPLDDRVWTRFEALAAARPAGFRIAALMRPPDPQAGEDETLWLERARRAAELGPLGHHTHWGGPGQARPTPGTRHMPGTEDHSLATDCCKVENGPAGRVRREGTWLREAGLQPTLFCGGGWYSDEDVAEAVAELGYADCTATSFRPPYLADGAPRLHLDGPELLELPSGRRLLALPSTHSIGMLVRALPRRLDEQLVHVYFHDTDLLDRRRALALRTALRVLALRRTPTDLDAAQRDFRPAKTTMFPKSRG
jgi:hypothetical protein